MDIDNKEECKHILIFEGNFFGANYEPEDFEDFDYDEDTKSSDLSSDSNEFNSKQYVDHKHDWEPEIPLSAPSPKLEEEENTHHRQLTTVQNIKCHPYVEYCGCQVGAPIPNHNALPSHEQYKISFNSANIYTLFRSELDWKTTQWAKMCGPVSTAFYELLSIPGVCVLLSNEC